LRRLDTEGDRNVHSENSPSQGFLDYCSFNIRREINTALLTVFSMARLRECVISFVNNYIILLKSN
jgi:hypothetical protein